MSSASRDHPADYRLDVLAALAVGVIVHDKALRIIYANRAAGQMLGVTTDEAVQRDVADSRWIVVDPSGRAIPPDEVPASVALRTRTSVNGVILGVVRPDHFTSWITADAVPLLGKDGAVDLVVVSFTDVTRELTSRLNLESVRESLGRTIEARDTALQRVAQALESTEAQNRAVLRAMAEGVAVHAVDGSIVFANPSAERILGLTLDQMQGRHPVDPAWRLTDGQGMPLASDQIPSEITRRTGEPQVNVIIGVQRATNGETAWLSVNTSTIGPAKDPRKDGRFSVVATFTDITVERNALAEAQHTRDHLREIASALPGVVIEYLLRTDGTDQFCYVSEPARDYLGTTPEDLMRDSRLAWARVHPDDVSFVTETLRRGAAEGTSLQFETRLRHVTGTYRHIRIRTGVPKPVAGGVIYRAVLFDVTEQRWMEESMREAQRRETIGTLAAGMAHNFNNMLAVIVPSIEMAQSAADPELAATLASARTASRAATELVQQLMQLVRKDTKGPAETADLAEVAREVAELCRRTFGPAFEIACAAAGQPHYVRARRAELQQVLINLCINARDALDGRQNARLELRVRQDEHHVMVDVQDNGPGIAPEVQKRLGDPFFTTKPAGHGTGLGLATAYGIIGDLGGIVRCHSKPGGGARFEISLPRSSPPESSARVSPTAAQPESIAIRVLLVDDEVLVRKTMEMALQRFGASVHTAGDGPSALAHLQSHADTQLVLLDYSMPGMSGSEVLRRIRAFNPTVPVYFVSGFLPRGFNPESAAGVLAKPVELDRLRTLIAEVLGR